MKVFLYLFAAFCSAFPKDKDEDCAKFPEEIPEYTDAEAKAIGKYFPQIASIRPAAVASHFISRIAKTQEGYYFHFYSLESIRSHECKDSGLITMVLDGSFTVFINEKAKVIEWDPEESKEKPFKVKLK
jgi:hypothetical protein